MRGLALNFASTHQVGNTIGISKVGESKQLLITIVELSFFIIYYIILSFLVSTLLLKATA
ncbi:hypothetical protein C1H87_02605 [Flavivirga eckloniae]|uniref:Uncharacterized protein n=1 Tax=Flavivirga eckloniae TaxID=1803846 RepID=A0A2K9PKS4_9FLAO|nr:hypothetical protein C1H87_02605 [Flavivirga eckloniae]